MFANSQNGYTVQDRPDGADIISCRGTVEESEEVKDYNPLSSSLRVSSLNMLGVSAIQHLFGLQPDADQEEEEEEEEDPWDAPLTEQELALLDLQDVPQQDIPQDLRASVCIEALAPPDASLHIPTAPPPPPSSSSSSKRFKKTGKLEEPVLCKICYEEFQMYNEIYTLKCDHVYCKECLSSLLDVLITQGAVLDLTCPQPGCGEEISPNDVSKLASSDMVTKYEQFVILAALRADPNVRWCPLPTCSNPVKGPPAEGTEWLVCGACEMHICFKCGDERHDPAACGKEAHELLAARHKDMREAQLMFDEWQEVKKDQVKPCPGCKGFIEKNNGCNHMTCRSCKHQFCWLCLGQYDSSHYRDPSIVDCYGKQYWSPPPIPDAELKKKYNWIYFPPNYQYEGVDGSQALDPSNITPRRSTAAKKAKKVSVYVGMGVAIVTLGVPAAVIGGPIYGVYKLRKMLKARDKRNLEIVRR